MFHEVDVALRDLILAEALAGTEVEVAFDAPTKEWSARRNAPTVNLFLYDVQEDLGYRREGLIEERGERGEVIAVRGPHRYFALSYLVTAWTSRPEDEHRLLSSLLARLVVHETLPMARLTGSLAALGLPAPMTVAVPPAKERGLADVWTALGGALKASLDLVVTAPLASVWSAALPPVTDRLYLRAEDSRREPGSGAPGELRALRYPEPEWSPGAAVPGDPALADAAIPLGMARLREPGNRRRRRGRERPGDEESR